MFSLQLRSLSLLSPLSVRLFGSPPWTEVRSALALRLTARSGSRAVYNKLGRARDNSEGGGLVSMTMPPVSEHGHGRPPSPLLPSHRSLHRPRGPQHRELAGVSGVKSRASKNNYSPL